MPIPAYRAKQSTDTTGTGTLVLNAAASNARSFQAAFGNSTRRVQYVISWANGFELGLGDFDGGNPGSLTRATVLASSNAGALVTLPGGTKDVFTAFDPAAQEIVAITGTATLALADVGNTVLFQGAAAATLNLPAVATVPLGAGFLVLNQGTAALTLDPNGAETINGAATLALRAGSGAFIRRLAGAWVAQLMTGPDVIGNLSATGQILAAAGTAAAPAYSFAGDTDTGIYNAALNAIGIALGGAQVASFESNQWIQIGNPAQTFTPFYLLNAGASASQLRVLDFTALNENYVPLTTMRASINTDGSGDIELYTTPTGSRASERRVKRMTIPGSGAINMVGPVNVFSGDLDVAGNLRFNSGYGSAAIAYGVRAWVNFNGTGTVAIRGSGGVTSITDNAVGDYTVNFNFTMPDTNYAVVGNASPNSVTIASGVLIAVTRNTTSVRVLTSDNNTDQVFDFPNVDLIVVR